MKNSETIVIKRSQINLNPYNPKRHTDEAVKLQKKNLKEVGFLGGVTWNETSGNLIDGHRRIKAMDEIHKYDGTPSTDYEVKVERVQFDAALEKKQMTYMAVGNSKADYNLIAKYIDEIDYTDIGISEEDVKKIRDLNDSVARNMDSIADISDAFIYEDVKTAEDIIDEHANKPKMTKEEVKAEKEHCNNVASGRQREQDLYVFLSFDNIDDKYTFCELLGVEPSNSMMIRGEDVMKLVD